MSTWLILLRHGARNIRHGGLLFFFATGMTALGLFGLATFSMVVLNFQRLAREVQVRVGSVAFLDVEGAASAEEARARLERLPGVHKARLVPPEVALSRVKKSLGESGALLDGAAGVSLGWTVELAPDLSGDFDAEALAAAVRTVPGVDDVMHPGGEVERIRALLSLLEGAGVFLALLIALVTLVVVSNTVKLTLFARRDEIAIMKLVGATDAFVRVPFLIEGFAQGVLGALFAVAAAEVLHASLAGLLELALSGALGAFVLAPLPWTVALWLLVGGAALGLFGAAISVGRFLKV